MNQHPLVVTGEVLLAVLLLGFLGLFFFSTSSVKPYTVPAGSGTPVVVPLVVAAPTDYRPCTATLIEYDLAAPWSETWIDPDGAENNDHGVAPKATFELVSPTNLANRLVSILYKSDSAGAPELPSAAQKGQRYAFSLPTAFLDSDATALDNTDVADFHAAP